MAKKREGWEIGQGKATQNVRLNEAPPEERSRSVARQTYADDERGPSALTPDKI